ncbi:hypothetical protein Taro_010180 [Colocasia esculenta]|uniref:Uncharacterized protein n=1 Tax=Colocasia esculenta TaxID=4460 RepID=A0A843U8T5_COLES|nr:hypothetical protein [Colocasia esculenta]
MLNKSLYKVQGKRVTLLVLAGEEVGCAVVMSEEKKKVVMTKTYLAPAALLSNLHTAADVDLGWLADDEKTGHTS